MQTFSFVMFVEIIYRIEWCPHKHKGVRANNQPQLFVTFIS